MFDTLLELVKKEQTKLIQIYLGEREKKGEGLMSIYKTTRAELSSLFQGPSTGQS